MEENSNAFDTKTAETNQSEIICKGCSASLVYKPGTTNLKCEYCGAENEIIVSNEEIKEISFEKFLSEKYDSVDKVEVVTVKCQGCGAETTFDPNIISDSCAFCGSVIVVKTGTSQSIVKPGSLLPFQIDAKKAFLEFKNWINSLWWAPNDLKKLASQSEKIKGMYIPYWTYDSKTSSSYTGQRGDNYTTTETYRGSDGKTATRTVTKIRWTYASGHIYHNFDDVLVLASNSLPRKYTERLEPWDLDKLIPYDEKFLSGFKTETYHIDMKDGFTDAKAKMDDAIRTMIKRDIGGDHQQISSVNTTYEDITFKHILLPIWISAYRYSEKVYRFMVNARTGEVQGERPYSWIKITLAILAGIGAIAAVVYFINQ
ncbi:MAG TPA: hypothetical protein DDX39_00435 [Bacteroidales bacterium]|nr:MAG: hypothetical protein A2W98_03120 [Bacteroidetes bacterium GWF2_33_38]OFY75241.1 MAG: hypothetical protein A2265_05515 [Bacteroidetes bacterium RIFOXYA12_FULL_33_9]OFY91883.1 MAG: hypothetical protein A2236_04880 [Bacteroidetes bacterium RIFOXYA2_FULL_33_7]HBF87077.1 hypothetical protein [Bacteroidales bacterium]